MTGTLYLCATPIGNLEDMTFRVVRTLKEVDLIAAEDTRNSIKLLNHFDIHTPMTSYHEYNRIEKAHVLVEKLKEGQNIALITDAGTPGISDPGEDLVRICQEEGVPVTSLPGACACVTALTLSGLSTRRFCFEAFLPTEKKDRQLVLAELKEETLLQYPVSGISGKDQSSWAENTCLDGQRRGRHESTYKSRDRGDHHQLSGQSKKNHSGNRRNRKCMMY